MQTTEKIKEMGCSMDLSTSSGYSKNTTYQMLDYIQSEIQSSWVEMIWIRQNPKYMPYSEIIHVLLTDDLSSDVE